MSTEEYEYLVRRPKFQNDKEFEGLLNEQGAGGWILVSLLPEPSPMTPLTYGFLPEKNLPTDDQENL